MDGYWLHVFKLVSKGGSTYWRVIFFCYWLNISLGVSF